MEDHISCNQPCLVGILHCSKLQLSWKAYPGASHVELPMPKHLAPQPHTYVHHRLTLGLVYGDCERRPDWELPSLPLEGVFSRLGDEGDSGYQYHPLGAHYPAFQQLVVDCTLEHQAGTVAKTLPGVNIPQ